MRFISSQLAQNVDVLLMASFTFSADFILLREEVEDIVCWEGAFAVIAPPCT